MTPLAHGPSVPLGPSKHSTVDRGVAPVRPGTATTPVPSTRKRSVVSAGSRTLNPPAGGGTTSTSAPWVAWPYKASVTAKASARGAIVRFIEALRPS
jgi:hypothetical protein